MKTNALDKIPLTPGVCEWCGKICELEDVACSLSCEAQLHRVEAYQGRMVLRTLKRWRKHRGRKDTPGEGAITEVASLVDGFLKTDRIRRERHQQAQRAAAAAAKLAQATNTTPEAPAPRQSAAPVQDEPDDAQEDWMAREGRLAQYGDLDQGTPNYNDHTKRGFNPK